MGSQLSLNERQGEVLEWIAEGTPARDWPDYSHRTTAKALQSRGLVRVRGRGSTWTAAITDKGRDVLANRRRSDQLGAGRSSVSVSELLARLAAGGGVLRVPAPDPDERAGYLRAIAASSAAGLPEGKRMRHRVHHHGDLVIELVDAVDAPPDQLSPVPVPSQLDTDLPIIRDLMAHPDALEVGEGSRDRALRLVQALACECERRGHRIALRGALQGFDLVIAGEPIPVTMSEEKEKVTRIPEDELARRRYDWQRVSPVTVTDWSGRLVLTLHESEWKARHWADRQRWQLDSRLPQVLHAVEELAAVRILAQDRAERERRERRALWVESVPRARQAYLEAFNLDRLDAQVAANARAAQYRAYAAAVREAANGFADDDQREQLHTWAAWIQAQADALDPALSPELLRYVVPVDVSLRELDKYMPTGVSALRPPD